MKASDLRQSNETSIMAPIYEQLARAKAGGASYLQVSYLSPEQKRILELDGFSVNSFDEANGRETWKVIQISW